MIMEFAENIDLHRYLINKDNIIENPLKLKWAIEIVRAIQYLHSKRIIQCDIKAENILLTNDLQVKLSDFGLSNHWTGETKLREKAVGSLGWFAPELFQFDLVITCKADIYSLGMTFWEITSRIEMPYLGKTPGQIYVAVVIDKEQEIIPDSTLTSLKIAIKRCWI
jgi:serine/threonine protein kinase